MDRVRPRGVVGAAVSVLVIAGYFLPIWEMRADVRGLGMFREPFIDLRISGTGIAGHLQSFNRFGHMFGIRPIRSEAFVELRLFPMAVAAAVVLTLLWVVQGRSWQRWVVLLLLWGLPAGAIGLTQLRLAHMAYTRDPMASYYMDVRDLLLPVFGTKKILGATIYTWPGPGLLLFVVAALLWTLAPSRLQKP
ncbi:MAG: hypothetical protein QN193_04670 [Armatimonadota bacterium]|nr:hypothetical protein [Armatimonadota bacterium]MDR7445096.1 hypothetical protein [Armatimonadota bacterium]MDR7569880.1 hypothetical protein [Armatimonadota bacterium]MDR7614181.1 hypothetical protein [Armatimonadota bacterium]